MTNTGTLREAATQLNKNYGTLRHYAVRHKDTFPKPLITNARGRGVTWNIDEIASWWRNYDDIKGTGGAHHHKDPNGRATLGHKFRRIRERGECTAPICIHPIRTFYGGESVVEERNGEELNIYHERCYERCQETNGGSRQSEEFVA